MKNRNSLTHGSLLAVAQDFLCADYRKRLRKAAAKLLPPQKQNFNDEKAEATALSVLSIWQSISSTLQPSVAPSCVHRVARRASDVAGAEKAVLLIRYSCNRKFLVEAVSESLHSLVDLLDLLTRVANSMCVVLAVSEEVNQTDIAEYADLLKSLVHLCKKRLIAAAAIVRTEYTLREILIAVVENILHTTTLKGSEISKWIHVNKSSDCVLLLALQSRIGKDVVKNTEIKEFSTLTKKQTASHSAKLVDDAEGYGGCCVIS